MTYKELVDRIEDAVTRHKMLVDFGYGQLSDIKVLDNSGDGADYPYAFLLPGVVTRNSQAITYSFSLIVMEMAQSPREILKVQSDCMQYINDILADLRFDTTFTGDVNLSQSIQVFRERFQDEVAGATLNLQVTVADTINFCDAPLNPEYLQQVYVYSTQDRINDPDLESQTYKFDVIVENDGGYTAGLGQANRYYPQSAGTWKFVLEGQWKLNEPGTIAQGPVLYHQAPFEVHYPDTLTGWPTSFESVDTVYNVRAEWILDHPGTGEYEIAALYNAPGFEAQMTVLSGLEYRIYKAL